MEKSVPSKFHGSSRISGFTMIELIITVAILAILISIAIPSFENTIRSNQIASQTNALVTGMALARSEAVKRGARITLCARNGTNCAASTDWSTGWLIFVDSDGDGALSVGETTLQLSPTLPAGLLVTSSQQTVTFQSNGENFVETVFDISKTGCGPGQKRELTIKATGRTSLAKMDCP